MILAQENLWLTPSIPTLHVVTTNGVIQDCGEDCPYWLVMGGGAALEAVQRYPGVRELAALRILDYYPSGQEIYSYGFLYLGEMTPGEHLGIFQVKYHYRMPADLMRIHSSAVGLKQFIDTRWPHAVRLNFPGIGLGRLKREDVLPVIDFLPDNVTVCYL